MKKDWIVASGLDIFHLSKERCSAGNQPSDFPCIELDCLSQGTGKIINTINISEVKGVRNRFSKGQVLYGKLRPYLNKYARPNFDGACSTQIWVIDTKDKTKLLQEYLFCLVRSKDFEKATRVMSGTTMPSASWEMVKNANFSLPPLAEQGRIAKILSDADTAIQIAEKVHSEMQKILFATQIRLILNGAFSHKKLRSVIKQRSERKGNYNCSIVLSVTNNAGFVLSEEKFARRIASADTSKYKIVHKGQFAYNPARLNVGSIAYLKKWEVGLVSPMYIVLETKKDKLLPDFFRHWLQTAEVKQRIRQSVQGSVRQSVGFDDLCSLFIPLPHLNKQLAICKTLKEIENKMEIYLKLIVALKKQKRGLMQQLLTGKLRVNSKNKVQQKP